MVHITIEYKLVRLGPIHNRPSTDYLHPLSFFETIKKKFKLKKNINKKKYIFNSKMERNGKEKINTLSFVTCQVSGVTCQMSGVTCYMLRVICHLSLTLTAKATDPTPANSPIMQSTSNGMPILAIHSSTRSLQSTKKRGFRNETDRQTHRHTTHPSGSIQLKSNLKIQKN